LEPRLKSIMSGFDAEFDTAKKELNRKL